MDNGMVWIVVNAENIPGIKKNKEDRAIIHRQKTNMKEKQNIRKEVRNTN